MSSRFLLVTVLCTLFVGAQWHPTSATTSVMTDCVRRTVESETECKPFSATTWKTLTPQATTYDTLRSQTTTNTFTTQTTSLSVSNTLTSYPTSSASPTIFAAVTTITCTAADATAMLELSIVPFIGVAMLGVVQGFVL